MTYINDMHYNFLHLYFLSDSPPSWVDMVKEEEKPRRSLTFAWETFQPCNKADDVTVEYEYELFSQKSNSVVQSGIIAESEITLSNLQSSNEYNFRVRVFYSNSFENDADSFSDWKSAINKRSG